MIKLKGYRTLVVNGLAALVAVAAVVGVVIPESEQTAIVAGIFAIVNIVLRFKTTTPVGG